MLQSLIECVALVVVSHRSLIGEGGPDYQKRQTRWITLAREHSAKAAYPSHRLQALRAAQFALHQEASGGFLLMSIKCLERRAALRLGNTFAAQLLRDGTSRQAPAAMAGLDPRRRVRSVVDESHLGEPGKDPFGRVTRNAALGKQVGQLSPTTRTQGQLTQTERPSRLDRVGGSSSGVGDRTRLRLACRSTSRVHV